MNEKRRWLEEPALKRKSNILSRSHPVVKQSAGEDRLPNVQNEMK